MKKWIEQFQKMRKDPKGKAILFFGFYFVFFVVIIALLRSSNGRRPIYDDTDLEEEKFSFEVSSLVNQNYHFRYSILLDDMQYVYDGEKNGSVERFTFKNQDYYSNGENYFIQNTIWMKSENPYIYPEFFNTDKVLSLLKKAYLESETTYKSGKITYHFLLDTNLIYQVLFQRETDYDGKENTIVVNLNEEQNIESIIFDLNDYCKSLNTCQNTFKISFEYDEIGEVGEIKSPIE